VIVVIAWLTILCLLAWHIGSGMVESAVQREKRAWERELYERSRDLARIDPVDPKVYDEGFAEGTGHRARPGLQRQAGSVRQVPVARPRDRRERRAT